MSPALRREHDVAGELSDRFREIARRSATEEDLKMGIEAVLKGALDTLGIVAEPRYEVTFLRGRADAVYGQVIIEYEGPGKLMTKPGREETISQLRNQLTSRAQEISPRSYEDELKRMMGISLDGTSILFCQYRTAAIPLDDLPGEQMSFLPSRQLIEGFEIRGPYPVTASSVALMLSCLRGMARPPLTAAALEDQFGPSGAIASQVVTALYRTLTDAPSARTQAFYGEWRRLFGIVYGEQLDATAKRAGDVAELYGIDVQTPELLPLLFSVHTYFAALMKLLAIELLALQQGALVEPFVRDLAARSDEELLQRLGELEHGDVFRLYGINNFVEGDFFQWYLHDFGAPVAAGFRALAGKLADFEPPSAMIQPERAEDLLKELYQQLIPKSLRHDLGEYYTPDWLAAYLIDRAGYDGAAGERVLDPSCGSGTFLVQFIRRLRRRCLEEGRPLDETAELVLQSVVGFEINPLAVIAARTNYLLALGDLVRHCQPLDLPVYFCDSILTPAKLELSAAQPLFADGRELHGAYRYRAVVGDLPIPSEIVERGEMDRFANLVEHCMDVHYTPEEFARETCRQLETTEDSTAAAAEALFARLLDLDERGLDGIWARILKNSVAPLGVGRFDYVIGNPPWIQWEDLPRDYRDATAALWREHGLIASAGPSGRFALGKSKRDLSMLFTYACAGSYLKDGGTLAFLITQTVFQTGTGEVFRAFASPSGTQYAVEHVDDLIDVQPFAAQNWSAAFVMRKGEPTRYPVPYRLWKRRRGLQVRASHSLRRVEEHTERWELEAMPLERARSTSPWLIGEKGAHREMRRMQGRPSYTGTSGLLTWLDGVYWLQALETRVDGNLIVENLAGSGRTVLESVRCAIEPDLLCPFVPWSAIERWRATPTHSILVPHTEGTGYRPIPEDEMRARYPLTLAYLYRFREQLLNRSGYRQLRQGQPFYILGNSGTNFRAPYKVVWRSMGTEIRAVVLRHREWNGVMAPEVHKNTVSFVPLEDETEALYLCGMLNASFVTSYALASSVRGGKSFAGTSLLQTIRVPPFEGKDDQLAVVEHARAATSHPAGEDRAALDELVAAAWGIAPASIARLRETAQILL